MVTTDGSGVFTHTVGLPNGSYNWYFKAPRSLANSGTLVLAGGTLQTELGLMRAGDADNNNVANTSDFNILRGTFGKALGDPGYDGRADFTADQVVNAGDFNLLRGNFGVAGAAANCP